jgi:hypothetical protein
MVIACAVLVYLVFSHVSQNPVVPIEKVNVETVQEVDTVEPPTISEVIKETPIKKAPTIAEAVPQKWVSFKGDGFSFKYPDTYVYEKDTTDPDTFYLESNDGESAHTIYIQILPQTLDPKHIEGLYGPIEDPDSVMVGTQVGYGYLEGDAGWGSYRVVTPLGKRTLRIMFGGSGEEAYPFYQNTQLQNEILVTFLFE